MSLKTSFAATVVVLGCQLLFAPAVQAQANDPAAKNSTLTDADRAKRDADKVFQWIKFHADHSPRPGSAQAAAPAPAAKPAARQAAAPRANAEVNQASALSRESTVRETVVAQPAAPAPSPELAAAPAPQAQPLAAAPAPQAAAQTAAGNEPAQLVAIAPTSVPQAPRVEPKVEPPKPEPQADVPLQLLTKVEPEIPRQLLSTLRNGRVLVRFTVQPDGRVSKAEPIETSNKKLSQAAVNAVQQWRFAAIPNPREVTVEVGFRME